MTGQRTAELTGRWSAVMMNNYRTPPVALDRGAGATVWDVDGREYTDLLGGIATTILGHAHPRVVEAITAQAATLGHVSNLAMHEPGVLLAERLLELAGRPGRVFFCNSGAEANEGAMKLARLATPKEKYKFITFENSFHGRTFAAITATAQPKYQQGFAPLVPGFSYAPLNDLAAVEKLVDDETAAILVEPIQGEGGVNMATPEFLRALRDLCDQRGMILIFDEVQTGVGRCGTWWGYQVSGVVPDIMTMAKQLGGGTAIGAFAAKPEVAEHLKPGTHASTFDGNPLASAAGCAVFEIIRDENLLENAQKMGAYLKQRMLELKQDVPTIVEVRGEGLMIGVELTESGAGVASACLEKGLHINCTHSTVLRIMPPLNITREQLDEGIAILAEVLNAERGTGRQTANSKRQ